MVALRSWSGVVLLHPLVKIKGIMNGEMYRDILRNHLSGDYVDNLSLACIIQAQSSHGFAKRESKFCNDHRRVSTLILLRTSGELLNKSLLKNNQQTKTICGEYYKKNGTKSALNSAHVLQIQCQSVAPLFLSCKVILLNINSILK